jgi:c-di-GMP-binding flagellar brake protein YcgR
MMKPRKKREKAGPRKGSGEMGGRVIEGESQERRQWPRFSSEHLIAYTHLDGKCRPKEMGMAKTLDLSEGGVKIQTHRQIPCNTSLHMFLAVEEILIEATGLVVHLRELTEGRYELGASFIDIEERGKRFLASLT